MSLPKMSENVLKLYKEMMREASNFPDMNFRSYFLRRIQDGFRSAKNLDDPKAVESEFARARIDLDMLRRQAAISSMFYHKKPFPTMKEK